ncbi:MAG: hypothetical protein ACFB51_11705 [Anaerolineae bacterium]
MGSRVEWYDRENAILTVTITGRFDQPTVLAAAGQARDVLAGCDGPFSLVVDLSECRTYSRDTMKHLPAYADMLERSPDLESVVVVGANAVLRTPLDIFSTVFYPLHIVPNTQDVHRLVDTLRSSAA